MNWYEYFFEKAEIGNNSVGAVDEKWTEKELFIALVKSHAELDTTKEDLQELVRAYEDYRKGVRLYGREIEAVAN
jgi:hypothetical protein